MVSRVFFVVRNLLAAALFSFLLSGLPLAAACTGPGAPTDTQTRCVTAIQIPGNPLRSSGGSSANPKRAEYYLSDISNAGVDVIDTRTLTFTRRLPGFIGAVLNAAGTAVNRAVSGPNGVTTHGHWLYAGDGNSTLKVFDLRQPTATALKASITTGGTTRVTGLALSKDGAQLLAANDFEDPPFLHLFQANGDNDFNAASILSKVDISNTIIPAGFGLTIEQSVWDPQTQRFYVSIPVIANNPVGCNFGQLPGPITCDGGLLVVNPQTLSPGVNTLGAFDPTTNTGVVPLHRCGPNGATLGVEGTLLLGCSPQNNPSDKETLVINAKNKNTSLIENITGSDQVWFDSADQRYYTASPRDCGSASGCPDPTHGFPGFAQLGVIDSSSVLIEKIPQSSGSEDVAADAKQNFIFFTEVAPASVVGLGGDTTTVGQGICGSMNGCIAVYTDTSITSAKQRDCKQDDRDGDENDEN